MVQILDALSAKYDYDLGKVLRKSKKIVTEQVVMTVSQENLLYLAIILSILMLCFCKVLLVFKIVDSFQTTTSPTSSIESYGEDPSDVVNVILASFGGAHYSQGEFRLMQPFFDRHTVSKLIESVKKFTVDNFQISKEDLQGAIE